MNINANPHTTGGTEKIVFAVKSVRLKTLTEIGSTFNSGQSHLSVCAKKVMSSESSIEVILLLRWTQMKSKHFIKREKP